MYQRKANALLIALSAIGGLAGFVCGETVLAAWEDRMPNALLMGVYFGQLALFVGLMCLVAELISPALNGKGWRLRYAKDGWKLLVPATLLLLFVGGTAVQLLYGLYIGRHRPPQNIVVAIDVSESMSTTDPNRESFRAAKELVQSLDGGKRIALLTFNNEAGLLQPLAAVSDRAAKDAITAKLDGFGPPSGGTNIEAALAESMKQIESAGTNARASMVILISDGYSDVDLNRALSPYTDKGVAVNTVGVNAQNPQDRQGNELLRQIAQATGGAYQSVEDVRLLSEVFDQIYRANQGWHLVGERTGAAADSAYYAAVRVLGLIVVGLLMGLSLGILFDNRFLARSFSVGGAIAGLLAGLIVEQGFKVDAFDPPAIRAAADVVLAVVLSVSTLLVPFKENRSAEAGTGLYRRSRDSDGSAGEGFGKRSSGSRKFQ